MTLRRSTGLRRLSNAEISSSDRARANHTGTQAIATVDGLQSALDSANTAASNAGTIANAAGTLAATKANATALGVAANAENLGAFSGSTIPDNQSAKQAMQALETAVEGNAIYNRGTPNSVNIVLKTKLGEHVSVSDWGVVPSNVYVPGTGVKINRALEEAPLGSTLHFKGLYYVEVPIIQRRGVNIHFELGSAVSGLYDDDELDLWTVAIEEMPFSAGDVRRLRFDNFYLDIPLKVPPSVSYASRHTFVIRNAAPLIGNLQMRVDSAFIRAPDDAAGYAVHIDGLVTQMHIFDGCMTVNGIYLDGCADRCIFKNGQMDGIKPGVIADLAGGAFKTTIRNNIMTSRDGALIVLGGSQIDFHYNQIEQVEARGANQNEHSASVILSTASYGSRGVSIKGNNFGGAERVDYHIYAKSSAGKKVEDLLIEAGNTFSKAVEKDIKIADSGVRYTTISSGQLLRGERGTGGFDVYPDTYDANTDDVNALIDIDDSGTGTRGVRLPATRLGGSTATALENGWGCPATFYAKKDEHDRVSFNGYVVAPGAVTDQQFATLPEGFRPSEVTYFSIYGATGVILTNGAIIATTTAAGNVGLSEVSFYAKRAGYDPSY